MGKPIQVFCFLNGQPIETLPEEAKATMRKRLSDTMSEYYTQHPEEFKILADKGVFVPIKKPGA